MSQMPPQPFNPATPPPGYSMPPKGGNGWGIASLITGLVGFCVPVAGGLLAMLFGVLGIMKAKKVSSGMGLSVAGLILGLISAGIWALFGTAIWGMIQGTKANRDVARQFITDLHSGNISAAAAATDGSIPTSKLDALSTELKGYGNLTDVTTFATVIQNNDATLGGILSYGEKKYGYNMTQVKAGDKWKVTRCVITPTAGQ